MTQDEKYMKQAIKQAKKAYALDEVPIGCVIVAGDKIIARGYNRRNTDKIHSHTLSSLPSAKPAKRPEIGVLRNAPCMSPLSHVRCVPEQ